MEKWGHFKLVDYVNCIRNDKLPMTTEFLTRFMSALDALNPTQVAEEDIYIDYSEQNLYDIIKLKRWSFAHGMGIKLSSIYSDLNTGNTVGSKFAKKSDMDDIKLKHYITKLGNEVTNYAKLPPGLTLYTNAISDEDEKYLINSINNSIWNEESTLKRRVQHYGLKYDYKKRDVARPINMEKLPDWTDKIVTKMMLRGGPFYEAGYPTQVIVNEYLPGQGIGAHVDALVFGDTVVSFTLSSAATMIFTHKKTGEKISVFLPRKSAVVMTGDSRYEWTHEIQGKKSDFNPLTEQTQPRGTRISLTFRTLKPIELPTVVSPVNLKSFTVDGIKYLETFTKIELDADSYNALNAITTYMATKILKSVPSDDFTLSGLQKTIKSYFPHSWLTIKNEAKKYDPNTKSNKLKVKQLGELINTIRPKLPTPLPNDLVNYLAGVLADYNSRILHDSYMVLHNMPNRVLARDVILTPHIIKLAIQSTPEFNNFFIN